LLAIIFLIGAGLFSGYVKSNSVDKVLAYGISWDAIGGAADVSIMRRFKSGIFKTWSLCWVIFWCRLRRYSGSTEVFNF
jgi:hypothetical protein